jgi:hypothetical protein
MVSQCVENNRTDPLTYSCRWMHEGADLRSYVAGCVRSGTAHQKHKATCFARAFSALTDMRSEKHSHLAYCSWLTSNNDAFAHILHGTPELWCAHIKNTRIHRQLSLFLVPRAVPGTAFSHTLSDMPYLLVIETRILVH